MTTSITNDVDTTIPYWFVLSPELLTEKVHEIRRMSWGWRNYRRQWAAVYSTSCAAMVPAQGRRTKARWQRMSLLLGVTGTSSLEHYWRCARKPNNGLSQGFILDYLPRLHNAVPTCRHSIWSSESAIVVSWAQIGLGEETQSIYFGGL